VPPRQQAIPETLHEVAFPAAAGDWVNDDCHLGLMVALQTAHGHCSSATIVHLAHAKLRAVPP
jgi:hypothetical protein